MPAAAACVRVLTTCNTRVHMRVAAMAMIMQVHVTVTCTKHILNWPTTRVP